MKGNPQFRANSAHFRNLKNGQRVGSLVMRRVRGRDGVVFLEIHFSVPSLEISMGIKDTDTWKFSGALKISRTWKNPGPLEISSTPGNFQASWKFQGGTLFHIGRAVTP